MTVSGRSELNEEEEGSPGVGESESRSWLLSGGWDGMGWQARRELLGLNSNGILCSVGTGLELLGLMWAGSWRSELRPQGKRQGLLPRLHQGDELPRGQAGPTPNQILHLEKFTLAAQVEEIRRRGLGCSLTVESFPGYLRLWSGPQQPKSRRRKTRKGQRKEKV